MINRYANILDKFVLYILKYNKKKKRSLAKNFEKEYKLSAVDLQPSTDKNVECKLVKYIRKRRDKNDKKNRVKV